jgi:hypothetical protein
MAARHLGVVHTRRLTGMTIQEFALKDGAWGNFRTPEVHYVGAGSPSHDCNWRRHLTLMTNAKNCSDVVEAS